MSLSRKTFQLDKAEKSQKEKLPYNKQPTGRVFSGEERRMIE